MEKKSHDLKKQIQSLIVAYVPKCILKREVLNASVSQKIKEIIEFLFYKCLNDI